MTLMNKYELMAMAAGFLLGGLISSIITEKVVEKRMNEEVNKELDKLRAQKVVRLNAKDEDAEEISKNISKTGSIEVSKHYEPIEPVEASAEEMAKRLSKFSESSIDAHEINTHEVQYNTEVTAKDEDYVSKYGSYEEPIHIVTFEDCCDAPEGWKTEYLKWYSEDDVLTDEDNDPVDFSLIGNATDNFDENVLGEDEDTIYVSNRNTMTIYEVQKIEANYYEEVMGGMAEWEDDRLSGGREKMHKRKEKFDD